MSIAPFALAALILLAGHLRDIRTDRRDAALLTSLEAERAEWIRERQELLTRVQAPHLIPSPLPRPDVATTEPPQDDEWDLVGTISPGADA